MTLDRIIEKWNLNRYDPTILSKGKINWKSVLKQLRYIEICEFWFDNDKDPNFNTWIDVEGIGYGWLWCANKVRRRFKFLQKRAIIKCALNILKDLKDDHQIIVYKNDDIYYFGVVVPDGDCYTRIRMSNKELDF